MLLTLMIAVAVFWPGAEASGQNYPDETQEKAKVMILGSAHFGNPGQDVINFEFPDVLKPKYQRQMEAVVESLGMFEPTKVAVEVRPDDEAKLDSLYRAYRQGEHELSRSETQQLGFRLGNRFGYEQLYAIDHKGAFPFGEVMKYAKKHEPEFIEYFESVKKHISNFNDSLYANASIREILRYKNSEQNLGKQRNYYARTAPVGDDTTWVGVELVAEWHRRNIQIFAHLARLTKPGDRVIVIFGSGHAPLLRYFVESSKRMELVDPLQYL